MERMHNLIENRTRIIFDWSQSSFCKRAEFPRKVPLLAPRLGAVSYSPCVWNYYPPLLPCSGEALRLSCSLAKALTPVQSATDLGSLIQVFDYTTLQYKGFSGQLWRTIPVRFLLPYYRTRLTSPSCSRKRR